MQVKHTALTDTTPSTPSCTSYFFIFVDHYIQGDLYTSIESIIVSILMSMTRSGGFFLV